MKIWALILYLGQAKGAEDYHYDDQAADSNTFNEDGERLVGASKGSTVKTPFLVAWNTDASFGEYSSCTGSLITKRWVLSAAHCITSLISLAKIPECIKLSNDGIYKTGRLQIKCTDINGNIKIELLKPKGVAYLKIDNVEKKIDIQNGFKIAIDFVVRHKHSYRGGGDYGTYGGYDITLVHLENSVPGNIQPACLPGMNFTDSGFGPFYNGPNGKKKVQLAGFGRYFREPCITDKFGKAKFHYCENLVNPCHHDAHPGHPLCKDFLKKVGEIPPEEDEVIIYGRKGPRRCFRPTSPGEGSHGWCSVTVDATQLGKRRQIKSWGFCSKDCYLDHSVEPNANVIREVENVDILEDDVCNEFLQASLKNEVKFKPEILCIGFIEQLSFSVYKLKDGKYRRIPNDVFNHPYAFKKGSDVYIRSSGTCNGDSGGPVFIKEGTSFVVLGAVSGGRGVLSNCGGVNNPTHYTRIKLLVPWVLDIISILSDDGNDENDEIPCIVNKNGL